MSLEQVIPLEYVAYYNKRFFLRFTLLNLIMVTVILSTHIRRDLKINPPYMGLNEKNQGQSLIYA